ncbi:MAG: VWA domain-containing protein [Sandaracinaceae bacterium]|nr:VWA domain-containing protein [Sandaracinaceae bacterium]
MSWQHGDLLWLLLAIPLIAAVPVGAWLLRRRATARFGQPGVVRELTAGVSGPWRATRGVLWVLAFAFAIVALAGPQYGSRTRTLRRRGVDVVIALDFSKSMLARDVAPSRIERAKAEIVRLLAELDGDRVGVVAFAGEAMEFPMTTDYAALSLFFRDLGPYDMPVGGTAIARALVTSKRLLDRASRSGGNAPNSSDAARTRVVILMTDGEDHEGDPVAAARELAAAGIRVYTVGIGSRTGEPIPTYAPDGTYTGPLRDAAGNPVLTALTRENEQQLEQIAEATGGRYFRAPRGQVGVDQIRRELRQLRQHENEARRVTVHEARYALALFPALLLLLLEAILPEAWIGRRRPAPKPRRTRRRVGRTREEEVEG